ELGLDYLEINAFPRSPDHTPPPPKFSAGPSTSIDMGSWTADHQITHCEPHLNGMTVFKNNRPRTGRDGISRLRT
ncbi:MAG: hypothetical protein NZ820_07090, partial [Dehalococcoidia bacterium]|nr:hypothetical protein [Dehalococcoidia bacterium]